MKRREFLRAGAVASAGLALAGRVPEVAARVAESAVAPGISAADRDIVAAIAPVMLAGALPAEAQQKRAAVQEVVDGVSRLVAGLPPHLRKEVGELFMLLDLAPARRFLAGVSRPWPEASPEEIDAFLERWRDHPVPLLRSAYLALHDMIIGAWYALPASWPAIGYPGAPKLG
jgi:hypothetical protein